eukprot:TRINITY_DN1501_c0_g1_i1.p1 TRINITY_DN1501_c0_g1~~TRINITY_DN1501_c0_g1_i1.p1  ORF type:complete len:446 (-),score=126.83 TRINITY_DN1501_c0_g1_i1:377-1714(-)
MYGVTVCTNMIFTTFLYMLCMRFTWKLQWWKVMLFSVFLFIDVSFWTSVLVKVPNGGYVAIIISFCFFLLMLIWFLGEYRLKKFFKHNTISTQLKGLPHRILPWTDDDEDGTKISVDSVDKKTTVLMMSPTSHSVSKDKKKIKRKDRSYSSSSSSETESPRDDGASNDGKTVQTKLNIQNGGDQDDDSSSDDDVIIDEKKGKSTPKKSSKSSSKTSKNPPKETPPTGKSNSSSNKTKNEPTKIQDINNWTSGLLKFRMLSTGQRVESKPLKVAKFPHVMVFITDSKYNTPRVFEEFIRLFHGFPETTIFLKIHNANTPFIPRDRQVQVRQFLASDLPSNQEGNKKYTNFKEEESFYLIQASYGYADTKVDLVDSIKLAQQHDLPSTIDADNVTFVVPAVTIRVVNKRWYWRWILYLYSAMKSLFVGAINKQLPTNTMSVGTLATL